MKFKYAIGTTLLAIIMIAPASANCFLTPALSVEIFCVQSHAGCGTAYSNVNGGKAPYDYEWIVTGGTIDRDYVDTIDFTSLPGSVVTVFLWVTDDCGNTVLASRVCEDSSGSGGVSKQPDPETLKMTVGQILDWLYEVKKSDFDIVIQGSIIQKGLLRGDVLDVMVVNIKDEGDRVTLYLETDNNELIEFDHAIIDR